MGWSVKKSLMGKTLYNAAAEQDINKGRDKLATLSKQASTAANEAKTKIGERVTALRSGFEVGRGQAGRDEAGHRGALEGI